MQTSHNKGVWEKGYDSIEKWPKKQDYICCGSFFVQIFVAAIAIQKKKNNNKTVS